MLAWGVYGPQVRSVPQAAGHSMHLTVCSITGARGVVRMHCLVQYYDGTNLQVGLVRRRDELLQGSQLLGLSIGIHQLGVHLAVLLLLAHHQQELHQLAVAVRLHRESMATCQ